MFTRYLLAFVYLCLILPVGFASPIEIDFQTGYVEWENPMLPPNLPHVNGVSPEFHTTPEGLTLVDSAGHPVHQIDLSKKIVIFIHGWTPSGNVPGFPYPERWHNEYNVFVFRWHRASYQRSIFPIRPLGNIDDVTKILFADYERLRRTVGYPMWEREIRVVGYSLGALPAVKLAEQYFISEGFLRRRHRRIDLIEPSFFGQFLIPKTVITEDGVRHGAYILDEMTRKVGSLRDMGIATTIFSSSFGNFITPKLHRIASVVSMHPDWLGGDVVEQHTKVLFAYFASMSEPYPNVHGDGTSLVGINARTPTEKLFGMKTHFRQISGTQTVDLHDDLYTVVDHECDFGREVRYRNEYTGARYYNIITPILGACF